MIWAQGWFWSAFTAWTVSADGRLVRDAIAARRMARIAARLMAISARYGATLQESIVAIERFRLMLDELRPPRER